jgi:hypothetical protein
MIWLLIGYMWLFIHRPFEIWPVLATFRIERVYMLLTIACWVMSGPRVPSNNRLYYAFVGFIGVMILSWLASPYMSAGTVTVENYLKYAVFFVLLVTTVRTQQDLRTLLVGHLAIMTLLMLHCLREYFNGSRHYTQGIVRLVPVGGSYDYNDLAGLIVCSLPLAWVLWRNWPGITRKLALLAHFGIAGYCIMLTGSRMGFVGMGLATVMACFASPRRKLLVLALPLLMMVVWGVLPQDRRDRYFSLVDSSVGPAAAAGSAGRLRLSGFVRALPLFEERPLMGFGPNAFGQATGTGMMPHNLYGQLLSELGIAGVITLGMIYWGVARNTMQSRLIVRTFDEHESTLAWHVALAAGASVLLLAIMGWGFNFLYWHVWLWLGGFQLIAMQCLTNQYASAAYFHEDDSPLFDDTLDAVCIHHA